MLEGVGQPIEAVDIMSSFPLALQIPLSMYCELQLIIVDVGQ